MSQGSVRRSWRVLLVAGLAGGFGLPGEVPVRGAEIVVDNVRGSDAFDGNGRLSLPGGYGPVRTIRRALQLAGASDTVVLVDNGIPYHERIALCGPRHSGSPNQPFVFDGGGAVVTGMRAVPLDSWRDLGGRIWRIVPWEKSGYLLAKDGALLPRHPCAPDATELPKLPPGSWCAWRGAIHYHAGPLEYPPEMGLEVAAETVGLSLYAVHHVVVTNVKVRHFQLDGIVAHDQCRDVLLHEVELRENGRAGLSTGGTSDVKLERCTVQGNRAASILVRGLSAVRPEECELDVPPKLVD